jgi:pimeloyl-ACP methyl ester carboxylesterase
VSSKPGAPHPAASWAERGISALNGVVGDYLDRNQNGLAIPMAFVQDMQPLALNAAAVRAAQPSLTGKLVILVHGWCCNEDVWRSREDGETYATKLQRDLGFTPFAVRYNSGMPIAQSGAAFAGLLTALVDAYPRPLDEIVLIGHSMGGLVIRGACHTGKKTDASWLPRVRHAFYLGTPHDGADLERFAQGATVALATSRNPITRLIGRMLDVRSAGVRDLHDGEANVGAGAQAPMPWLATARHHRLVGTLTKDPGHPVSQAFGDGLVKVPAGAEPGTADPDVTILPGVHHMQLARDPGVYAAILAAIRGA